MKHKIKFNERTSVEFEKGNKQFNRLFLITQMRYLNDLLKARGYVYMNNIYENLGLAWNPFWENSCIIIDDCKCIKFDIRSVKDGFNVTITW